MHVIGIKMAIFYSLPAKKSIEKFGNFSPTDNFLTLVSSLNEYHPFRQQGKSSKIKPIVKIIYVVG